MVAPGRRSTHRFGSPRRRVASGPVTVTSTDPALRMRWEFFKTPDVKSGAHASLKSRMAIPRTGWSPKPRPPSPSTDHTPSPDNLPAPCSSSSSSLGERSVGVFFCPFFFLNFFLIFWVVLEVWFDGGGLCCVIVGGGGACLVVIWAWIGVVIWGRWGEAWWWLDSWSVGWL